MVACGKMNVTIRADASVHIGTGHVMRCLTLADSLKAHGADVSFICRLLDGNICDQAESKGYNVYRLPYLESPVDHGERLMNDMECINVDWRIDAEQTEAILKLMPQDTDWLIIDNYAIDKPWEMTMRPYVGRIMVIDDLANRGHDCDVLLDQNFCDNSKNRYTDLVPDHCIRLLGPKYALLRTEFFEARKRLTQRNGSVRKILVFFGGSDPSNETSKVLEALWLVNRPEITVDVVVGAVNPHKEQVEQLCLSTSNTTFYYQVDNMAEFMAGADLAIGGGGTSTWERCYLGLPTIALAVANNQIEVAGAVSTAGAAWDLGWHEDVDVRTIANVIEGAIDNPNILKQMSASALALMESLPDNNELAVLRVLYEESNVGA